MQQHDTQKNLYKIELETKYEEVLEPNDYYYYSFYMF